MNIIDQIVQFSGFFSSSARVLPLQLSQDANSSFKLVCYPVLKVKKRKNPINSPDCLGNVAKRVDRGSSDGFFVGLQ